MGALHAGLAPRVVLRRVSVECATNVRGLGLFEDHRVCALGLSWLICGVLGCRAWVLASQARMCVRGADGAVC